MNWCFAQPHWGIARSRSRIAIRWPAGRVTGVSPVRTDRSATFPDAPLNQHGRDARDTSDAIRSLREALGDRISLAASTVYGGDDVTRLAHFAAMAKRFDIPLLAT